MLLSVSPVERVTVLLFWPTCCPTFLGTVSKLSSVSEVPRLEQDVRARLPGLGRNGPQPQRERLGRAWHPGVHLRQWE